jgi:hypothetical protein
MARLGLLTAAGQGPAKMPGVAGERRDGDVEFGGQITERFAIQRALIEVWEVFVGADFTRFMQGPAEYGRGEFSGSRGQGVSCFRLNQT